MTGDTGTLSGTLSSHGFTSVGTMSCGTNSLTFGAVTTTKTVSTYNGTSGHVYVSMPFQGTNFKLVVMNFLNFVNNANAPLTYTFPTPFTTMNYELINLPNGLGTTQTLTSITWNPNNTTNFTGYFWIAGF